MTEQQTKQHAKRRTSRALGITLCLLSTAGNAWAGGGAPPHLAAPQATHVLDLPQYNMPAMRPDDQHEFPSDEPLHDTDIVKPGVWDQDLRLVPGTRVASLNISLNRRYVLVAPLESRLGENQMNTRCGSGERADVYVDWKIPGLPERAQSVRVSGQLSSGAASRPLTLTAPDSEAPTLFHLTERDSAAVLSALQGGYTVTLRWAPQGRAPQTLTFPGKGFTAAWAQLDGCRP